MKSLESITSVWPRARKTFLRRLFLDRQAAFWLSELDPMRSLTGVRAEVVAVIDETADAKTFLLRPSANWSEHRAGQHTVIEVEINGVRVRRCYSITSPPGQRPIAITVKRVPGGLVSPWLHDRLRPGEIIGLDQPAGEFVLPAPTPEKLLFLSGGSGMTPVMAMLRDLAAAVIEDLVFVHHARSRADVIFRDELAEHAERHSGLRLILCLDDADGAPRGFDEARLAELVPDFARRSTYLCGPPPMMDRAEAMWADAGVSDRLVRERFSAAPQLTALSRAGQDVRVELSQSGRQLVLSGGGSLLDQLERAGERPASGCRIGICRTCTCRKASGTVENVITGEVSSDADEEIQLCISTPRSDLQLDL